MLQLQINKVLIGPYCIQRRCRPRRRRACLFVVLFAIRQTIDLVLLTWETVVLERIITVLQNDTVLWIAVGTMNISFDAATLSDASFDSPRADRGEVEYFRIERISSFRTVTSNCRYIRCSCRKTSNEIEIYREIFVVYSTRSSLYTVTYRWLNRRLLSSSISRDNRIDCCGIKKKGYFPWMSFYIFSHTEIRYAWP